MREVRLLPKWGGFDDIVSELERVYSAADGAPAQPLP